MNQTKAPSVIGFFVSDLLKTVPGWPLYGTTRGGPTGAG